LSNFIINPYSLAAATQEYCQSVSTTSQGFNTGRIGVGTRIDSGHVLAGKEISSVTLNLTGNNSGDKDIKIRIYNNDASSYVVFATSNTDNIASGFANYTFSGSTTLDASGGYIGIFIEDDTSVACAYSASTNESNAVLAYFGSNYSDTWENQGTNDSLRYCADYS